MNTFDRFQARPIRSVRDAADSLRDVANAKHEASVIPHGRDISDANLEIAKAENWTSGSRAT
jgi:hypothetical protein